MPSPVQNINVTVSSAQRQIQDAIQSISETELLPLGLALDRILASNLMANMNVPAFDNSAMDGYAFCSRDLARHHELIIVGSAYAGHPYSASISPGQTIRITTGAKIPSGCDCVIPQELAQLTSATTLDARNISTSTPGQNIRRCGEDIARGAIALAKGTRLGPPELGLMASLGIAQVQVLRRIRVAIFSTGDELLCAGKSVAIDQAAGHIYDSNRISLHAMLTRCGAEIIDLGVLADDPEILASALKLCAPQVDAIITSGGVAGGAADFTKQVFQRLGQMHFWSVAMRPGRPFAFGKIDTAYVFGLPGNPVAMMVSFYFLVRPALQLLSGAPARIPVLVNAIATEAIAKKIGRTEFQRGICQINQQGQLTVRITGDQGSGMLSSMAQANCMLVLAEQQADVAVGDSVQISLFEGLI